MSSRYYNRMTKDVDKFSTYVNLDYLKLPCMTLVSNKPYVPTICGNRVYADGKCYQCCDIKIKKVSKLMPDDITRRIP